MNTELYSDRVTRYHPQTHSEQQYNVFKKKTLINDVEHHRLYLFTISRAQ